MPPIALDVHLQIALAKALTRNGVDVVHISRWRDRLLRTAADDAILDVTTAAGRVLVSRDVRTLPGLARRWALEGRFHAGIILVPPSINQDDIGGALAAILHTLHDASSESLANTVIYAQPQR